MNRGKLIRIICGLLLVLVLGIGGYLRSGYIKNPSCHGETMGTTYSIRLSGTVEKKQLKKLYELIDAELMEINRQMSTWDPASEISRFNHLNSTEPMEVSADFARVVERALEFSLNTGGAFDPTLQPLLNLWGFGSEGGDHMIPTDDAIASSKALTGWHQVKVLPPANLQKGRPEISLALGAIAKGYGVDAVAHILDKQGFENWFVEIGGEVVAMGLNPSGTPWKIGIQYPSTSLVDDRLKGILHLSKGAIATSGDYRNYIEKDGAIYSHILDPRTGRAVFSNTASVTVYASNCTDADASATALFVMGPKEGLEWVEQQQGMEAMFLIRDETGEILEKFSSGFLKQTGYIPVNDANAHE